MPALRPNLSVANAHEFRRARLAAATQARISTQFTAPNPDGLEIAELNSFRLREPVSGRKYTVIKIRTESGPIGYGETGAVPPEDLAQAGKILLGKPASACEVIRQGLRGLPALQAAVNMALLDVIGRFTKAPIYQVLGGPTRNKARVLTPLNGESDEALLDQLRRAIKAGSRAFVVLVPPPRASNQGQAYVRSVRQRLDKLREAGGDEVDFVLDGGAALSPGDASSVAAALEKFHLLWFDEPCRISNLSTLRKIANETVTPLGLGRQIHDAGDFQDLLREAVIDVLRPNLALNGLTQIRKMAALAETYYVTVAPFHEGGPVGVAAALHLAASLPNFFIQQIPMPEAEADRKMRADLMTGWQEKVQEGFAALPTGHGLGVTVNESAFEKYKDPGA